MRAQRHVPLMVGLLMLVAGQVWAGGHDDANKDPTDFASPTLNGGTGLFRTLSAYPGRTFDVRVGLHFEYFRQKRFIVGADGADVLLIYAKVEGIEDPKKAMTAFLVERGAGVSVEHLYGLMGTRGGGTGRLVFKDAPVPIENVLGGEAGIGNGTRVFHQMMIPERMTSAEPSGWSSISEARWAAHNSAANSTTR